MNKALQSRIVDSVDGIMRDPGQMVLDEQASSYVVPPYQRQRQLTLGDLLLENRIVFLQGEIFTEKANEVVM